MWFLDGSNHEIASDLVLVGFLIDSKKKVSNVMKQSVVYWLVSRYLILKVTDVIGFNFM